MDLVVGGIYVIFGGDEDLPYKLAKVVSFGGNTLVLKLWYRSFSAMPTSVTPELLQGETKTIPISLEMFNAWGPPAPLLLATELVTPDEVAAVDWT